MICLSRSLVAEVFTHLEGHFPHEACGLFLGRRAGAEDAVTQVAHVPNLNTERAADRYELDPRGWMAAEKAAAARGERILGVYHSHPDHPARPSQTDLENAWPNFVYVIVSVANGTPRDVTCWRLREDRSAFDQGDLRTWRTES